MLKILMYIKSMKYIFIPTVQIFKKALLSAISLISNTTKTFNKLIRTSEH